MCFYTITINQLQRSATALTVVYFNRERDRREVVAGYRQLGFKGMHVLGGREVQAEQGRARGGLLSSFSSS